jgi:hypothetical protein
MFCRLFCLKFFLGFRFSCHILALALALDIFRPHHWFLAGRVWRRVVGLGSAATSENTKTTQTGKINEMKGKHGELKKRIRNHKSTQYSSGSCVHAIIIQNSVNIKKYIYDPYT